MPKKTADVTIPAPMFQLGAFPMVCAKTGEPAQERKSVTATYTSPWAAVGIIGGVFGVALLAIILRKQLAGSVPLAPVAGLSRSKKYGSWTLGSAAVAFISMFVLPSAVVGWGFLAFAVFGIVGLGMVLVSREEMSADLASDQQTVTLKKVHPIFAETVRQMMASSSMYAPAYQSNLAAAPAPYQIAPPMATYGSSGIPAPRLGISPPVPAGPQPAVSAAPAPTPDIVDPFRS